MNFRDSLKQVRERLLTIADKHSQMALEAEKTENARKHLVVVEKAVKMILDVEQTMPECFSPILRFSEMITADVVRSQVYQMYLDFCEDRGIAPLSRNMFYNEMRQLGFVDKNRHDNSYLIPPKRRKVSAAKVLLELENGSG